MGVGGGGCARCQKSYYKTTNRKRDLVLHTEVTKEVTLTWRGERAVWFERVSDRIANYFCFKNRERGDTKGEGGLFCLFVCCFLSLLLFSFLSDKHRAKALG